MYVVKIERYSQSRRGKSRNKVAVGEPAAGSFLELSLESYHKKDVENIYILFIMWVLKEYHEVSCEALSHKNKNQSSVSGSPLCRQRSAMDILARCSMKDAAKCVKCHDLQIPAS